MPNRIDFAKTIATARRAGNDAAQKRHAEIAGNPLWSECGGAHMRLFIEDKRWRRFLDSLIEKPLPGFGLRSGGAGLYFLSIRGLAVYQEMTVCLAAANAALAVIETETGGQGKSQGYLA